MFFSESGVEEGQLKGILKRELHQAGWEIAQEEHGIDILPLPRCNDGSLQAPARIRFWECKLKEKTQAAVTKPLLRFRACHLLIPGENDETEAFLKFYVYVQILEHFRLANHLLFRNHY